MPTPSSKREWTDEYTLLCEKCGYVIEGLDTNGNCPECGKPIAESLPENRPGTPWQQLPRFTTLIRTWMLVFIRPRESFRVLRADRDALGVRAFSIAYASVVASAAAYIFLLSIAIIAREGEPIYEHTKDEIFTKAVTLLVVSAFVLMVLTELEHRLIAYFVRRPSSKMIHVLIGHACVAWVAGATGMLLGSFLLLIVASTGNEPHPPDAPPMSILTVILLAGLLLLPFVVMFCSLVYGFVAFHIYLFWGLRHLKYANRVRPETPNEPTTDSSRTT